MNSKQDSKQDSKHRVPTDGGSGPTHNPFANLNDALRMLRATPRLRNRPEVVEE